ncbi:MAG TPA: hypothetical protein GX707_21240 [Epulopiscium sp.]|nr:hypothetical protein [Candidatus Epulonipiscium sp.]
MYSLVETHLTYIPVVEATNKKGQEIQKINCSEFWKGFNSYGKLQDNFYDHMKEQGFDLERGERNEGREERREHMSVQKFKEETLKEDIQELGIKKSRYQEELTRVLYREVGNLKKHIIITMGFVILIVVCIIVIYFNPIIKGKLSNEDHITLYTEIYINNQKVDMEQVEIETLFQDRSVEYTFDNGKWSTQGKEYGQYKFNVLIPTTKDFKLQKPLYIEFEFLNPNAWCISQNDVKLYLYTHENDILGNSIIKTIYNDRSEVLNYDDIKAKENKISINWGL